MSKLKAEDFRMSSSSLDDFFSPPARPIRTASSHRIRIASLGSLTGFAMVAKDTLVHLSQKDFWKLGQDADGPYIERLVEDDEPVQG